MRHYGPREAWTREEELLSRPAQTATASPPASLAISGGLSPCCPATDRVWIGPRAPAAGIARASTACGESRWRQTATASPSASLAIRGSLADCPAGESVRIRPRAPAGEI